VLEDGTQAARHAKHTQLLILHCCYYYLLFIIMKTKKRKTLEPRNLPSLQSLLLFHVLPARLHAASFLSRRHHPTLAGEPLELGPAVSRAVTRPDAVVRADGVIHGVDRLLVPRSVQDAFNRRRSLASSISAALPTGAPEVDPRTHRLLKKPAPPLGAPPALPVWDAMAPGPSIAPAPAPGPGTGTHRFDGPGQVKDFIQTLLLYGGYNELADILVNLTSLATEMGRLVSEGYVLTVLAPNDEAMARLTTDQLSEPGSPESTMAPPDPAALAANARAGSRTAFPPTVTPDSAR
jgi:uncharacterized surface protein with fasciclin (FAS1) repeats